MKILGIDSSGLVASVALVTDGVMTGEYTINNKKTHSQTLLPVLEAMLAMADVKIGEVDAIAVAAGPGSFTGLRIGAATAKGLAGALDIPIVPVPTLEGLAANFMNQDNLVCPLMDARRSQAYYGIYSCSDNHIVAKCEQSVAPVEEIIDKVNQIGERVIFLGDGVPVFRELLEQKVSVPFSYAMPQDNCQRAGIIAGLGVQYLAEGKGIPAREFAPTYLRLSQAERERMEKITTGK